jgi:hypothetical protein
MEDMINAGILFGKPDWKNYFHDICTHGKLILKRTLKLK